MARVLAIICFVGVALVGTGVAVADEPLSTSLPIDLKRSDSQTLSVVVAPGDHLWKISARHLQESRSEIAPYWLRVIEVNTPNLRSGNPDLIYPGEIIELP